MFYQGTCNCHCRITTVYNNKLWRKEGSAIRHKRSNNSNVATYFTKVVYDIGNEHLPLLHKHTKTSVYTHTHILILTLYTFEVLVGILKMKPFWDPKLGCPFDLLITRKRLHCQYYTPTFAPGFSKPNFFFVKLLHSQAW